MISNPLHSEAKSIIYINLIKSLYYGLIPLISLYLIFAQSQETPDDMETQGDFGSLTIDDTFPDGGAPDNCSCSSLIQNRVLTGSEDLASLKQADVFLSKLEGNTDGSSQEAVPAAQSYTLVVFEISYGLMRHIPNPAPPKRFHRTFWRSTATRMLERESEQLKAALRSTTAREEK